MLSREEGLIICFSSYILSIFLFATIYSLLFKQLPKRFVFNKEVLAGKRKEREDWLNNKTNDLKPKVEVLEHVVGELEQGKDIEDITAQNKSVNLPSGNKYQILKETQFFSSGHPYPHPGYLIEVEFPYVNIQNRFGQTIGRIDYYGNLMLWEKGYGDRFKRKLRKHNKQLLHYQKDLKNIEDYHLPAIWSFLDFFYFSASTQTTLGFGDILPNSTLVRMIVIFQVLIGLSLLVLLINLVILHFSP